MTASEIDRFAATNLGPWRLLARAKVKRLPRVLRPDEQVLTVALASYKFRRALVVVTNQRLLSPGYGRWRAYPYECLASVRAEKAATASQLHLLMAEDAATLPLVSERAAAEIAELVRERIRVQFVDLRDVPSEGVLDRDGLLKQVHDGLYLESFPRPEEREDLGEWRQLLWGARRTQGSRIFHALLAGVDLDSADPRVEGFVFFEFYLSSRCGLISYLAVDPDSRRRGCGRELLRRAVRTLTQDAIATGEPLRAVFAEIHDPGRDSSNESMDPAERVSFFAKLGSRRVPIPYVQPDLGHGQGSAPMWLVALPINEEVRTLPACAVSAFVHELYGVGDGPELSRIEAALMDGTLALEPLNPVPEDSAVRIAKYAVAFHFVTRTRDAGQIPESSAQLASFERDLLAYAYRSTPPFSSTGVHVPRPYRRVELELAPELRFVSEGRVSTLVSGDRRPPRELRLRASVTRFRSGVEVQHLALTPAGSPDAAALTEYDLIKLVKIWEGGENCEGPFQGDGPEGCVRFRGADGREGLSLTQLARAVFRDPDLEHPWAGTIQLITEEDEPWGEVWTALRELKAETGVDVSMPCPDPALRRMIEGVGGIVQGLIDFREIDDQELREVFAGMEVGSDGMLGVHKGTLLFIGASDRVLDVGLRSFGVSPYLLLPHAVLLHNERVLRDADSATTLDEGGSRRGADRLSVHARRRRGAEERKQRLRRALDTEYLPNVFHYPNERGIYERGLESRGLGAKEKGLRMRLAEVESQYETATEARRRMADDARNGLLLVLSFAGYRAAFPGIPDWVLIATLLVVSLTYLAVRR